jgi:hypothetical protein
MKQVLAIFKKDARHLWPEILASVVITAAFAIIYPVNWREVEGFGARTFSPFGLASNIRHILPDCFIILVPLSWLILIGRLVQVETLVGNTQFWVTRPYEWHKLLAAKALFLAAFLYAPFFIAQCTLLAEAGFNPQHYLQGLFINLFYTTVVFVLPLAVLSSLTSSFGRLLLAILGLVLYIATVAYLDSRLPYELTSAPTGILGDVFSVIFIVCGCGFAILVLYITRKVRTGWLLLASICLLLTALGVVNPDRWLMNRQYPALNASTSDAMDLAYAGSEEHQPTATSSPDNDLIDFSIPLTIRGASHELALQTVALKVAMETPDGVHWESGWQEDYSGYLAAGNPDFNQSFKIRRVDYDRLRKSPVTLRLSVAVHTANATGTFQMQFQPTEITVPEVGICTPQLIDADPTSVSGISCRSAMRRPRLNYVTVHWTEGNCPSVTSIPNAIAGNGWVGNLNDSIAEFGITSVWLNDLQLSNRRGEYQEGKPFPFRRLCPGSEMSFTSFQPSGGAQIMTTVDNLRLPEESTPLLSAYWR